MKTYCDFGQANRKEVLATHNNEATGRRGFKRISKTYHGVHGWRVWLEDSRGVILEDTNL